MSPSQNWDLTVLYSFTGGTDGEDPIGGVILDGDGNLYGTTNLGGNGYPGCGTVFQVTPCGAEQTLHLINCPSEGDGFFAGLIMDPLGNLYGAAAHDGPKGGGTVFEVSPAYPYWNFSTIYAFTGASGSWGPTQALVMDQTGNLYGASLWNGNGGCNFNECGFVFKLSPSSGGWTITHLYDFTGGNDGTAPLGVKLDAHGNLWGVAQGGAYGYGVVFEITP